MNYLPGNQTMSDNKPSSKGAREQKARGRWKVRPLRAATLPHSRVSADPRRWAFTLVEVLVAVAMIGSVMTVLLLARLESVRQADRAHELTRAIRLAEQIVVRMDLPGFERDELRRRLAPRLVVGLRWEISPTDPPDDWPTGVSVGLRRVRVWPAARPVDVPLVDIAYFPQQESEDDR